ncbi:hypothetical protein [Glycomyces arizonensis]|uniref:hypothetical protein n=1 Tax=Glycomyces arizonensis TaxID=256035 RepID=UPI0003F9FD51|nr:hypothetical protein [Glycomyces arizonensis]
MTTRQQDDVIDGLAITYLPEGLGAPSDFEFEWGEVRFTQRVWESEVEDGVWRVDLQVQAMRGARLSDKDAMRRFLIEYHEKDDGWATEPFGDDGFSAEGQTAVLIERGLAVEVRDPFDRRGAADVKAVVEGIRLLER